MYYFRNQSDKPDCFWNKQIEDESTLIEGIAISEMKRVLRPDGILILSFSTCMDFQTIEMCAMTEQERT